MTPHPPSPDEPTPSPAGWPGPLGRRAFLATAGGIGLGMLVAGCSGKTARGGTSTATAAPGSLGALTAGTEQLSFLGAQSELPVGRSLLTFGLSTPDNRLLTGGQPRVWAASDQTGRPLGPFTATWLELSAYQATKDTSPRSDLRGFYAATVELPSPGNWQLVAVPSGSQRRQAAAGAIAVHQHVVAAVGTKARRVATPVAVSSAARTRVCTRTPPCPLHTISLDRALASGRPTVVVFATPLLCVSRMCGPVVDEALVAAKATNPKAANFVHVEIYPQRDTNRPAPAFKAWGFPTEPWTIVTDRRGVIRARFEGPVAASQTRAALHPLL
jgi:hypothetical protein